MASPQARLGKIPQTCGFARIAVHSRKILKKCQTKTSSAHNRTVRDRAHQFGNVVQMGFNPRAHGGRDCIISDWRITWFVTTFPANLKQLGAILQQLLITMHYFFLFNLLRSDNLPVFI